MEATAERLFGCARNVMSWKQANGARSSSAAASRTAWLSQSRRTRWINCSIRVSLVAFRTRFRFDRCAMQKETAGIFCLHLLEKHTLKKRIYRVLTSRLLWVCFTRERFFFPSNNLTNSNNHIKMVSLSVLKAA